MHALREDFRRRLATFYAELKLAPPYDSVEKALTRLTTRLNALSPEELEQVQRDQAARWTQYRAAFVESGLHLKHRGIITGLIRSGATALPPEYKPLLDSFLS
jgi:hypothetical protein